MAAREVTLLLFVGRGREFSQWKKVEFPTNKWERVTCQVGTQELYFWGHLLCHKWILNYVTETPKNKFLWPPDNQGLPHQSYLPEITFGSHCRSNFPIIWWGLCSSILCDPPNDRKLTSWLPHASSQIMFGDLPVKKRVKEPEVILRQWPKDNFWRYHHGRFQGSLMKKHMLFPVE